MAEELPVSPAAETDALTQAVLDVVTALDPGGLIGVYLYGSGTTTGLGPQSDIDLLLVTREPLSTAERRSLVDALLDLSGWIGHRDRFPEVAGRRPLDVTSLVAEDLAPLVLTPRRDAQFGEWLRGEFTQGVLPMPERSQDVVLQVATALASHRVLWGAPLAHVVPEVSPVLLRQAQLAVLPGLVEELPDDARNVLLTLARALHTMDSGTIVPKHQAAVTAAQYLDGAEADLLNRAAAEYRGEERVDWDRELMPSRRLADRLLSLIDQKADQGSC